MTVCSIGECERPIDARGLCKKHYDHQYRSGILPRLALPTPLERFLAKLAISESGCWEWVGTRLSAGYGQFHRKGGRALAHRYSYETFIGPIPVGLTLDHLCRNRACVNPDHLEPVTMRENILRGESMAALNAAKTHCKRGHEFTEANTGSQEGGRYCRECHRIRQRAWRCRDHV